MFIHLSVFIVLFSRVNFILYCLKFRRVELFSKVSEVYYYNYNVQYSIISTLYKVYNVIAIVHIILDGYII